jgi:hypothetical protein
MDLASLITDTLNTTAGMADAVTQISPFEKQDKLLLRLKHRMLKVLLMLRLKRLGLN